MIEYIIKGKPLTSANRHMIVMNPKTNRPSIMKSQAARAYQGDAVWQLGIQKKKNKLILQQPLKQQLYKMQQQNYLAIPLQ